MSRSVSNRGSISRESVSRESVSRTSISGDSGSNPKRASMTSTTIEEDEIHDLVLMFANSRIPRGSDAFQSILDDLLPLKEEHEHKLGLDEVDSGFVVDDLSSVQEESEIHNSQESKTRFDSPKPKNTSMLTVMQDKSHVRANSPKSVSHVHWPNAEKAIASSPSPDQLHHARIYMKTVPAKPILKHDDDVKDHINVKTWWWSKI